MAYSNAVDPEHKLRGQRTTLLVVDEKRNAVKLRKRLTAIGYLVIADASSGENAIEKAAELRPDLILMSIRIAGEMDGVEAAGRITVSLDIPVVYLTPRLTPEIRERAKITEPFGYVLHSCGSRELHLIIETALDKHRTTRRLQERESLLAIIAQDASGRLRHDVTDRQTQVIDVLGRLAAGMAHDMNNLITVLNFVFSDLPELDDNRELLEQINLGGKRVTAQTQRLRAYGRTQVVEPKVLDFNELVAGLEQTLSCLIGEDIVFVTDLAPDACNVVADYNQLEQVIMDLAVIARSTLPSGATLSIETREVEISAAEIPPDADVQCRHFVVLTVRGTGAGMNVATRKQILPDVLIATTPAIDHRLNLTAVSSIINQNGGHVRVSSESHDDAAFDVYLPRAQVGELHHASPLDQPAIQGGTETILLAEDDLAIRSVTRYFLQQAGYKVLSAASGTEALHVGSGHVGPIDLLVTDLVMPKLNGQPLADMLLRQRPGMRVLYLSGHTEDSAARRGHLQPPCALLHKPFTKVDLTRKIRLILDEKGASQASPTTIHQALADESIAVKRVVPGSQLPLTQAGLSSPISAARERV